MEIKNSLPFSAAIISAGIIIATAIGADSFFRARQLSDVLSITGSAEKIVTADIIKWQSSIARSVNADQLASGSAQIKNDIDVIKKYFRESGVLDSEITINPATVSPVCDSQGGKSYDRYGNQSCGSSQAIGYNIQQVIIIESDRVDEVARLAQSAADEFVGQGIIFTTQNLEYYYSKLAELRLDLLAEATKDAQERAQRIAQSTGKKIGDLQSASQGVFQVTAKNSVEVSDYGAYDTSSLEKKITGVVRASFTIK
ncbi:MAG: SIMPL domain-containing protein [Minisyncoccales bacterium]